MIACVWFRVDCDGGMVAILKTSGGQLEVLFRPILGPIGATLGHVGAILGYLEAISGHPGAILAFLVPSWGHSSANLETSWSHLRHGGAILEPSRDHIVTVLGLSWALFG